MEITNEKIRTYLDNMFVSIPQTEQAVRMKEDMYGSMLDKFNGYITDGANEDEAFGRVVSEFGSVEDIRAALAENSAQSVEAQPVQATQKNISPERKKHYDRFKIKQGIAVACGVIFCIAAVFGYPYYRVHFLSDGEEPQNFVFGILVALGVFLFVWAGAGEAKFYDITQPDALRPGVSEERMTEYRRFLSARQWLVPLAVALFVASPFMYSSYYGMVIMPVMVAFGVGILIIVGSVHGTYNDVRADK